MNGQNKKSKNAEKKKEQLALEQEKAAEAKQDASVKHQFNIQSKSVQKRMKKNQQETTNYYNKKLGKTLFQELFGKKNKRKK